MTASAQEKRSQVIARIEPLRAWSAAAIAICAIGALTLFFTAPHHGEFWWSDSPRHALNGVFLSDLLSTWPADPKTWAMQYYLKYPALTILFYPPLFYIICAPVFLLTGASHAAALAVAEAHYFALALGMFFLTRRWVGAPTAIAVAVSVMAAPGVALWGRQVMLEVPSLAFLTWSMVALTRYLDSRRNFLLYVSALLLLAAVYTKISAAFVLPVFALAILTERGVSAFRDRHVWLTALLVVVGLVPIAILTVKFGGANVQSIVGVADSQVSRTSFAGWAWYARQMPALVGWPLLVLATFPPIATFFGRIQRNLTRSEVVLLVSWFAFGYLALSSIDLKEARHAVLIVPPILVSAALSTSIPLVPRKLAQAIFFVSVAGTGLYTLLFAPVPSVDGYREAAQWIAAHAPKGAIVVFSGKRDGSFIFNMRTLSNRQDISTIRIDKLLLVVAVRREIGVSEKALSQAEITKMLDADGVGYVVAQDDFWTDIPVMARFQQALLGPHFENVATIPIVANVPTEDKVLHIYKNLGPINLHPKPLQVPLAIIDQSVTGKVGK
jgi:hypothetical protein